MLKNELADVCVWVLYVLECVYACVSVSVRVCTALSLEAHAVTQPGSQGGPNTEPSLLSRTHTSTCTQTNKQTLTGVHVMTYITKYI